jgi:hypothetical protein
LSGSKPFYTFPKYDYTPNNFTLSSHTILFPFKWKDKFWLFVFFPMAIAWNLSGLAFIRLSENQFISSILSFSKVFVTTSISLSPLETVLSSTRQLNILKRISKYMTRLGRLTSYYSFILSNFNYCPVIWHYCSEKNSIKMEKNPRTCITVYLWRLWFFLWRFTSKIQITIIEDSANKNNCNRNF